MLSIILFILKLIGIILAFIVFLILLVLFVPIRYNIYADYKEEIYGQVKVHWLLHFIYFKGVYVDENFNMKLRILGKVFYDSDKVDLTLSPKEVNTKKYKDSIKDINSRSNIPNKSNQSTKSEKQTEDKNYKKKINIHKESVTEKILVEKDNDIHNLPKEGQNTNNFITKDSEIEDIPLVNKIDNSNPIEDTINENTNTKESNLWVKVKLIFAKIGNIIMKVLNIPKKVRGVLFNIGQKFNILKDKLSNVKKVVDRIKKAIEKIQLFLQDEVNKDSMKHIFKSLKRIWRHVKPKKITGEIEFGAKEPYETGQILAFISMGYGLYGKNLKIYPNFEEEIITGNITIIGRIRLITLLIIGVKLILYKNNRQLVKNIMALKEEL